MTEFPLLHQKMDFKMYETSKKLGKLKKGLLPSYNFLFFNIEKQFSLKRYISGRKFYFKNF